MARKLIGFDPETLQVLELLSKDSRRSLQQLADEAFADLLTKHHRPRTSVEALKQSARPVPANENKPKKRRGFLTGCLGHRRAMDPNPWRIPAPPPTVQLNRCRARAQRLHA